MLKGGNSGSKVDFSSPIKEDVQALSLKEAFQWNMMGL